MKDWLKKTPVTGKLYTKTPDFLTMLILKKPSKLAAFDKFAHLHLSIFAGNSLHMNRSSKQSLKSIFLFLGTLLSTSVYAQVDPELDTLLMDKTDSMRTVLNNKSLSAAIAFSDGTTEWEYTSGFSASGQSATPDQVYLIGSITKTMIGACMLQLADEQILSLEDSLHEWLPAMNYINPDITIRQLLSHRSGLYDVFANPQLQPQLLADPDSIWLAADLIDTYLQPAPQSPGVVWSYCNTNYFLLGMIIEAATGNTYYDELRTRFFTPLNLSTLAIPSFEPQPSPVCHVWLDLNGDNVLEDAHTFYYNWLSLNSAGGAAGGYYATAMDVSRWMRNYQRGDLHSSAMLAEAHTTYFAPGMPVTYGLGLMKRTILGFEAYGHGGDLGYSGTSWYFPELDISISVLNNDGRITSWELDPVVAELLQTYINWQQAGIENLSSDQVMTFPNPFRDHFSVTVQGTTSQLIDACRLFTTDGKAVAEVQGTAFKQDELAQLPDGVYYLEIHTTDNNFMTQKVMKQ